MQQALESFVMQKTNFNYEVIIGDDCSTDNTQKIIREYEKKYPKIIKPVYRKKNIGIMNNLKDLFIKANGEYISLCEGDDFFTDKNKLQIQVDFLDKHTNYSICFHPVKVFFENNEDKEFIYPYPDQAYKFTTIELLNSNFIPNNSILYRNQNTYDKIPTNILPGDWYLHLYHAKVGKIGFINKIMASYRKHNNGLWWNYGKNMNQTLIKFGYQQLSMYFELIKLFNHKSKYKEPIFDHIDYVFNKLIEIDKSGDTKLVEKILKDFPSQIAEYFISFNKVPNLITYQPKYIDEQLEELKVITDSKLYKIWPLYTKFKKTFFKIIHKFKNNV